MGGVGSGMYHRWKSDAKGNVERCPSLDIRRLWRSGDIRPGQEYFIADEPEYDWVTWQPTRRGAGEAIPLDWTPCTYGGARPWFLCPGEVEEDGKKKPCRRRVAVLYHATCPNVFRCRHCLNLAYPSQKERLDGRPFRRAKKKRLRIGGLLLAGNCLDPIPDRPKGMHRKTYERIRAAIERDEEIGRAWWSGHIGELVKANRRFMEESEKRLPRGLTIP